MPATLPTLQSRAATDGRKGRWGLAKRILFCGEKEKVGHHTGAGTSAAQLLVAQLISGFWHFFKHTVIKIYLKREKLSKRIWR